MSKLTRRQCLRMLGLAAAAWGTPAPLLRAARPAASAAAGGHALFEPVPASVSGITWRHVNGRSPEYYLPETTGAGCAFFDYDNDGWMDIYLVNSGPCDFFTPSAQMRNALYRNNRDGTFTDVTERAGVAGGGYGMGVAAGDYDGDGYPDLYVTQYGRNILYHNNGNGTFTDVTERAGVACPGWSSSAVWFDYDNDGRLDLFVCRFVLFNKSLNKACVNAQTGERDYCYPRVYQPAASWLFHNNGDGTFTDVSEKTGIHQLAGKAWGVVATDVDNDGWMDLFVANDTEPNFLFLNRHGRFEENGMAAGVAFSADGAVRSGMGVDATDFDQDGWQDLFVDNISGEMYSLYRNNHQGSFDDMASTMGLASASEFMSGWGVKFFDYDNDGDQDLFIVNGHPDDQIDRYSANIHYREPLLLFHNEHGRLRNVSRQGGPLFAGQYAARGLAVGDFDNDGAIDVLISVNGGAPILARNRAALGHHWLGVHLKGTGANPDAIGTRIIWQAGDLRRSHLKTGGGSYLSSHDPREVLGIGPRTRIDRLEIHWPQPSRRIDVFTDLPIDRYITIVEGRGIL